MNIHLKSYCLLGAALLGLNVGTLPAQVTNINCGAVSTNVGAKLLFVNGTNFTSPGSVQPMFYQRVANRYGTNTYYSSTNLLFTALSAKTNVESAAVGAYVVCEVVSVSGPAGAVFYFWEQGNGRPNYAFPVGGTYPADKNKFILSNCENGAGRPDGDPFGSIRGRRFVVDKAGEYLVTFKLHDISLNHPTLAAPIHASSDPLTIKFATGVDIGITGFAVSNNVSTLVFKHGALTNMFVETSTNLTHWTPILGPFLTVPTTILTTNLFTNTPSPLALYFRLHGVTPP